MKLIKSLLVCGIILWSCSPKSSSPFGNAYQNTTARYNAYFIANEHMKEIEEKAFNQHVWNYNKILPIFPQFDSTDSKGWKTELEDCIEKASIAIQRHVGSKWEDDSYILVGQSRFYGSEFQDAIETYKYVNKKSPDDDTRHRALILLLKTFAEIGEINNAIAVSDFLKREQLNTKNERDLYVARAFLYQKRNDYNLLVQNLVKAEEIMPSGNDKARIEFIIGQVYQELGFESEAYTYYQNCLRNSPTYELAFYTKLNMAQVTQLTRTSEVKKVEKYFKKLLRDPKNLEYQDKIYYEWGNFDFKLNQIDDAIGNYKKSVANSSKNVRQKAYSYLKLGQIYYDTLKDYQLAKSYYDSTVSTMPKDEEDFEKISQRQTILKDFVEQILTIQKNDSLIALSYLSEDSVYALAKNKVEEELKKEEQKKIKEEKRIARATTVFDNEVGSIITTSNTGGPEWYFYNSSSISRGASEFKKKWGNRILEDNWRRSKKTSGELVDPSKIVQKEIIEQSEKNKDEVNELEIEKLLANIPKSEEAKLSLLDASEIAYYKLGNIYNFKLEEKENATKTFETLLIRFPESEYEPEVLYELFLIYNTLENPLGPIKGQELKSKFPESIYAKLVDNPNFREESQAATALLKKTYSAAYKLYQSEHLKEVVYMVDSALTAEPENEFSDNLKLLQILAIGKLDGAFKYQFELNNFKKNYPESELIEYVNKLIKASEEYQINLVNSAKARFIKYFEQKHFLIIAYKNQAELSGKLTKEVETYITNQSGSFNTGNLILDEDYAMILVNDLENRDAALAFLTKFNQDLELSKSFKGEKIYSFVISQDNFNIFYKTKDLNAYLNFFDQNYK